MTTQDSYAPRSQEEKQEPTPKGGVVGDDRSKAFTGEESGHSFGGPQEGAHETEEDESGAQAR